MKRSLPKKELIPKRRRVSFVCGDEIMIIPSDPAYAETSFHWLVWYVMLGLECDSPIMEALDWVLFNNIPILCEAENKTPRPSHWPPLLTPCGDYQPSDPSFSPSSPSYCPPDPEEEKINEIYYAARRFEIDKQNALQIWMPPRKIIVEEEEVKNYGVIDGWIPWTTLHPNVDGQRFNGISNWQ